MGSDTMKVRMSAFSVAMAAKAGQLEPSAVDALWYQAEHHLEDADPLRAEISRFKTAFEINMRRPDRVAELGHELTRAVEIAARPDAPDAGRADIYG